jgi:hypothetical protein
MTSVATWRSVSSSRTAWSVRWANRSRSSSDSSAVIPTSTRHSRPDRADHDRLDHVGWEDLAHQQVGQVGVAVGAGLAVARHGRRIARAGPGDQGSAVVAEQRQPPGQLGTQPLQAVLHLLPHL